MVSEHYEAIFWLFLLGAAGIGTVGAVNNETMEWGKYGPTPNETSEWKQTLRSLDVSISPNLDRIERAPPLDAPSHGRSR
jgi:hypothetical protein